MPSEVHEHDGHKHVTKTVNEEIFGLKIDDRGKELISEGFGWPEEKYNKVRRTMEAFWKFQEAAEELDEDLPKSTKISAFTDFLKSPSFKKLGIKIETPNDYLVLGYVFNAAILRQKLDKAQDFFEEKVRGLERGAIGGRINKGQLRKIMKIIDEGDPEEE